MVPTSGICRVISVRQDLSGDQPATSIRRLPSRRASRPDPHTARAPPARARSMNALTFSASFLPGDSSTPVDTSTPHGRTWRTADGDVVGRRGRRRGSAADHPAPRRPATSRTSCPNPAWPHRRAPDRCRTDRPGERRTLPAAKALMTQRTWRATSATSAGVSWPCSWAARTPDRLTMSITRLGMIVAEHADGEDLRREATGDVVRPAAARSDGSTARRRTRPRRRPSRPRRARRPRW